MGELGEGGVAEALAHPQTEARPSPAADTPAPPAQTSAPPEAPVETTLALPAPAPAPTPAPAHAPAPSSGDAYSVLFVGVSAAAEEADLVKLLEPYGQVTNVRLLPAQPGDTSCEFRVGFASLPSRAMGHKCIDEVHGREFLGRKLDVRKAPTSPSLFMGKLRKAWTEAEFERLVRDHVHNVSDIKLMMDSINPSLNRGFAFVNFESADDSASAYFYMHLKPGFSMDGVHTAVEWTEPLNKPSDKELHKILAVYVANMPLDMNTQEVTEMFSAFGKVTEVIHSNNLKTVKRRDFAFVYFAEHESVQKAISGANNRNIRGRTLSVQIARPQTNSRNRMQGGRGGPMGPGGPRDRFGLPPPRDFRDRDRDRDRYDRPPLDHGGRGFDDRGGGYDRHEGGRRERRSSRFDRGPGGAPSGFGPPANYNGGSGGGSSFGPPATGGASGGGWQGGPPPPTWNGQQYGGGGGGAPPPAAPGYSNTAHGYPAAPPPAGYGGGGGYPAPGAPPPPTGGAAGAGYGPRYGPPPTHTQAGPPSQGPPPHGPPSHGPPAHGHGGYPPQAPPTGGYPGGAPPAYPAAPTSGYPGAPPTAYGAPPSAPPAGPGYTGGGGGYPTGAPPAGYSGGPPPGPGAAPPRGYGGPPPQHGFPGGAGGYPPATGFPASGAPPGPTHAPAPAPAPAPAAYRGAPAPAPAAPGYPPQNPGPDPFVNRTLDMLRGLQNLLGSGAPAASGAPAPAPAAGGGYHPPTNTGPAPDPRYR